MGKRKTTVNNVFRSEKPDPHAFLACWRAYIRQMEEKRQTLGEKQAYRENQMRGRKE